MAQLVPILPFDGRNYVGICHIDVVAVTDVRVMPDEQDSAISDPVQLKTGASWSRIALEDDGGAYTEKWQLRKGAQYSSAVISGQVPKDRLPILQALWAAKGRRYLVIFTTRNGDTLLMGSPDTPALLLSTARTAGKDLGSDRNQYDVAFSFTSRHPVPFYLPAPPPAVPEYCPTFAQLLPLATIEEIVGGVTNAQTVALAAYYASNCPTMAQLIAVATDAALYAALSNDQAIYIANQAISIIDGGDATDDTLPVIDPGGGTPPPPTGAGYNASEYDQIQYAT